MVNPHGDDPCQFLYRSSTDVIFWEKSACGIKKQVNSFILRILDKNLRLKGHLIH